ncbi:hypothetical protein CPB86DRAFT_787164, partial [Serendipita vermifera]
MSGVIQVLSRPSTSASTGRCLTRIAQSCSTHQRHHHHHYYLHSHPYHTQPTFSSQWDAIPRPFMRSMSSASSNPPLEGTNGVPNKEKPLANSPPIVIPTPSDSTQSSTKSDSNVHRLLDNAQPGSVPPPPQAQRTRPRLRASKAAMTLTPGAVSRLRSLLSGPTPQYIRVGVRNKGCAGMSYHLEYVDKPSKFDEQVEQDGVKVLIDSKALFSIIGSEMDWVEDKL